MSAWISHLNADATDWLLEESNPHVRYFALRWLLDKSDDDPDVVNSSREINESGAIRKIFKRQKPDGYFGSDPRPHHSTQKYLMLFVWLGYRGNGGVKKAMEYCMAGCLQADGAYFYEVKERNVYLPCHGANLLSQMILYGYRDDPRTSALFQWILNSQEADGVWCCPSKVRPFPCLWATADVLRAFRDLPEDWVNVRVIAAREKAVEIFLQSNLSRYGKEKSSQRWFEFGFPRQWDSDILEVLQLIAPYVDPQDERIQEGLSLVMEKQDRSGRWPCEKWPKGGMWIDKIIPLDEIGKPSKWVTLHAYRMLKELYRE